MSSVQKNYFITETCITILFTLKLWLPLLTYGSLLIFFPVWKNYVTPKFFLFSAISILVCINCLYLELMFTNYSIYVDFNAQSSLVNNLVPYISLSFNPLSIFFSFLVFLIGLTTNIYVLNYFKNEANESLFIFWLNCFILSMVVLVLAQNFFTLFLGWELIGLSSFFLINFWNIRRGTLKSSFKAFTFNLISDLCLLSALCCFYLESNTTDISVFLFLIFNNFSASFYLTTGTVLLIICASIKSVQVGGHLWLPDSMEAPVPASSLIHSATLVSAGIYLLAKFNILVVLTNSVSILTVIGALSACYGGLVSASQTDLKKLLAYSTMSHCGFLWIIASNGNFLILILYLYLHGIFKAATFYCAGSMIYNFSTQDSRQMGIANKFLPTDSILLIVCAANLGGLPFTVGVVFKNFFFNLQLSSIEILLVIGFTIIGLLSGIIYFFRLVTYCVFDFYKGEKYPVSKSLFTVKNTNMLSLTSRNHVVAVVTLLLGASLFVFFFKAIFYSQMYCELVTLFNLNSLLYFYFYNLFYSLYLLIIMLLGLVVWRKNIFITSSLGIIISIIVLLTCEVKLWQRLIH